MKFRTMREPDPEQGLITDAERLTRFGSALRSTSLDELLVLWNVIGGDMSLVVPRPLLMQYLQRFSPQQARRHEARPASPASRKYADATRSRGSRSSPLTPASGSISPSPDFARAKLHEELLSEGETDSRPHPVTSHVVVPYRWILMTSRHSSGRGPRRVPAGRGACLGMGLCGLTVSRILLSTPDVGALEFKNVLEAMASCWVARVALELNAFEAEVAHLWASRTWRR